VLISLPIPLNYPVTREALAAGKHVICEKPAGVDEAEARQFLKLADEFPRQVILIAENFFYRDDLRLARSLLDGGAIGRVHLMAWRNVFQLVPREGQFSSTPWRWAPMYRGGPQLDAGVHHLAQIRLLCGDVEDLQGYVQYANPTHGGPSDLVLNMHFVSHAIGSLVAAHLPILASGETNEMRLYGADGIVAVGGRMGRRAVVLLRPDGSSEEHAVEADGGYYNEWLNFHDALVHDEPIVGTIAQSHHNLLLVMRALDSAEEHRVVEIADAPGGLSEAGVPLWRPRGMAGLFDGLPCTVTPAG
jgi:predicted dehydrogenase